MDPRCPIISVFMVIIRNKETVKTVYILYFTEANKTYVSVKRVTFKVMDYITRCMQLITRAT